MLTDMESFGPQSDFGSEGPHSSWRADCMGRGGSMKTIRTAWRDSLAVLEGARSAPWCRYERNQYSGKPNTQDEPYLARVLVIPSWYK